MFFHSWSELGHVALVSCILFVAIVAMLRVAGQKALAKMSGFDVVFTVTFGSIVANVVVARDIAMANALVALATLLVLQEIIRWFQSRYLAAHHLVREPPIVVLWQGTLLEDRLRHSSISADEVRAAVRKAGHSSFDSVRIVVLENDGDWSVVSERDRPTDDSALYGLDIPGRRGRSQEAGERRTVPAPASRLP